MYTREFEKMFEMEAGHWWFLGRAAIVKRLLDKYLPNVGSHRILDMGCGTGMNLLHLRQYGTAYGVDISKEGLFFCRTRCLKKLVCCSLTHLPFQDGTFDFVSVFDALEHIEQDEKTVMEMNRVLQDGGHFMVTVPAHQALFGQHDVALEHKRRYSRRGILNVLNRVRSIRLLKMSFYNTLLYPLALLARLAPRSMRAKSQGEAKSDFYRALPKWVNTLFLYCLKLEALLILFLSLPFGLSMVLLGQKVPQSKA